MSNRFRTRRYDEIAEKRGKEITLAFEELEKKIDGLFDSREKSIVLTKLEEAHMWVGKCLKNETVLRLEPLPLL